MNVQTTPLYNLQDIQQIRGERTTLQITSQTIEQGKCYGLIGKNGAGKTTLLKILAFLEMPTQGTVVFQGQEVTNSNIQEIRRQVVWLSQMPLLFSGTVLYNVSYPLKLQGFSSKEASDTAKKFIAGAGLGHLSNAQAATLSGGEAQRTCIARALATGAKVLLLDEPTAGLDADAQAALKEQINRLISNPEYTIVLTSHDAGFLAPLCEKKIHLDAGRVVDTKTSYYHGTLSMQKDSIAISIPDAKNLPDKLHIVGINLTETGVLLVLRSEQHDMQVVLDAVDSLNLVKNLHIAQGLPVL